MRESIEDFIFDHINTFVFLCFIIFILTIFVLSSVYDNAKWNNGYCSCGGKWEYVQPIGHAYTTDYMYKCDVCGKAREFDKIR